MKTIIVYSFKCPKCGKIIKRAYPYLAFCNDCHTDELPQTCIIKEEEVNISKDKIYKIIKQAATLALDDGLVDYLLDQDCYGDIDIVIEVLNEMF